MICLVPGIKLNQQLHSLGMSKLCKRLYYDGKFDISCNILRCLKKCCATVKPPKSFVVNIYSHRFKFYVLLQTLNKILDFYQGKKLEWIDFLGILMIFFFFYDSVILY